MVETVGVSLHPRLTGDDAGLIGRPRQMQDALAILDVIGVRVVFVEGLGEDAFVSLAAGTLIVDAGISAHDLNAVVDQVLSRASAALLP